MVYLVFFANGKQYKISTGVKVLPSQWSDEHQVAIVSNLNSKLDNRNNEIVNRKIEEVEQSYRQFVDTVSTLDKMPTAINIINIGNKRNMEEKKSTKKKEVSTIKLLNDAFEEYKNNRRKINGKELSKSSTDEYQKKISEYQKFLEDKGLARSSEAFTQKTFDNFEKYLYDKHNKPLSRHGKLSLIRTIINEYINPQLGTNITIKYEKPNTSDDKTGKFPLKWDEVQAIENCTDLDNELEQFRKLFLLQIKTGQRISDLFNFIKYGGTDEKTLENGVKVWRIKTQKTKTDARIIITDEVMKLLDEVKETDFIKKIDWDKMEKDQSYCKNLTSNKYNPAIKEICKLLLPDRLIPVTQYDKSEKSFHLYERVSSHCARYTFIVFKRKEGWTTDRLKYCVGHKTVTIQRKARDIGMSRHG